MDYKSMIAQYLWLLGSSILIILGTLHLLYTFFTDKFSSRNEQVISDMKSSYPILTKATTLWKMWMGFNGSHSSGVMFIGVLNFYLAVRYFSVLQADHFLFIFNILTVGFYLWLAKKYWFKVPFTGALITFICFVAAYVLTLVR